MWGKWLLAAAFGTVGALGPVGPAAATTLDQVRADVDALLGPDWAAGGWISHAPVAVSLAGETIAVTVPEIRVAGEQPYRMVKNGEYSDRAPCGLPAATEDAEPCTARYIDVGTVSLELVPAGTDLYEVREVTIPRSIGFKEPSGTAVGELQTGSFRLSGQWSRSLHNFLRVEGAVGKLHLTLKPDDLDIGLDASLSAGSRQRFPGFWRQDAVLRVENAVLRDDTGSRHLALGEFTWNSTGFDIRRLVDLIDAIATLDSAGDAEEAAQALETVRRSATLIGNAAAKLRLQGLRLLDGDGGEAFGFEGGQLTIATRNLAGPAGDLLVGFDLGGFSGSSLAQLGPDPSFVQQFTPRAAAFSLGLSSVPARPAWNAFFDSMASGELSEGEFMTAARGFVPQLLVTAGTRLRLSGSRVETPIGRVAIESTVAADIASPYGVSGSLTLTVTGLDRAVEAILGQTGPDETKQARIFFDLARGFSQRQTGADGQVTDLYTFALTSTGDVLLNGKQLTALVQALH